MTTTLSETTMPELASRRKRIGAFLIDHFAFTFLMAGAILAVTGTEPMEESEAGVPFTTILLMGVSGLLLYFLKDSINGVSFGRWVMGIMVRKSDTPSLPPSVFKSFLRNLMLIIWPVEFLVLASSEKKERLGDRIADTIVVENPAASPLLPRALAAAGLGIAVFAFTFVFAVKSMMNSGAYKTALQAIEQNEEILEETGGIQGYGFMPQGNINITNGYGEAALTITVKGLKKDLHVVTNLTKEPDGEWQVIRMSE